MHVVEVVRVHGIAEGRCGGGGGILGSGGVGGEAVVDGCEACDVGEEGVGVVGEVGDGGLEGGGEDGWVAPGAAVDVAVCWGL